MTSKPHIAAVIFDMDGLLLDTESVYKRASQAAAAALGLVMPERLYAELLGLPESAIVQRMRAEFGDTVDLATFRQHFNDTWRQHVEHEGIALKPGAKPAIESLTEHHIPFAIATSTPRTGALYSLELAGLARHSDILIAGDEVAHGKPAPDIFFLAAQRMGVAPRDCLVLEDSEAGIKAAANAAMIPVMIPDTNQPSKAVAGLCHAILPSLVEALELILACKKPQRAGAQPRRRGDD